MKMEIKAVFVLLFLLSVLVSSISQVLLKRSAGKTYGSKFREYLNLPVMTAYSLFFLSSIMTVFAYKYVPLSLGPVLEATGYVYVTFLSILFLKEPFNKKKISGILCILAGVILFNV